MAQPIRPYSAAEIMVGDSVSMGQGGMNNSAPVGPNLFDGSPISSAASTTNQAFKNQVGQAQDVIANTQSAIPQAGANAAGQVRTAAMDGSQIAYDMSRDQQQAAVNFAEARKAEMLLANNRGQSVALVGQVMNGPDGASFMNDIATGKAMAMGVTPGQLGA